MSGAFVPASQYCQQSHSNKAYQREPSEAALSSRQDDERRQQRPECVANIATDLEEGLREPVSATRSQPRDARQFRMKDCAAKPEQRPAGEQHGEARREGQRDDAQQCAAHAEGQ